MRKQRQEIITAVLLGVLVPALVLRTALLVRQPSVPHPPESTSGGTVPPGEESTSISVFFGDEMREMDLNDYLVGVLLQEMPASFAEEAKKAQAVVARTYTLRVAERGDKHGSGGVCTDYTCCQAYIDPQAYVDKGGDPEAVEAARQAVEGTDGMVLTYDGKLIDATYFSCSGGYTEDAAAVWGGDVPYLQSVSSPGEEYAAHYTDTVQFSGEEFAAALGADLSGLPAAWLGEITRTEGGGVDEMEIGGETYAGTELRKLLGLRSTAFVITATDDIITITTKGYGHRVGMSQYGADAMAAGGSGYEEILTHYYTGAVLEHYDG